MFRSKHRSTSTTTNNTTTTGSDNRTVRMATASRHYSDISTDSIPKSCFYTHDFLLGASMVIIQPSSGKVVLVNDTELRTWFLPRGRKDIGETLEQCALREAYEEVRFLVIVTYFCSKRGGGVPCTECTRVRGRGVVAASQNARAHPLFSPRFTLVFWGAGCACLSI